MPDFDFSKFEEPIWAPAKKVITPDREIITPVRPLVAPEVKLEDVFEQSEAPRVISHSLAGFPTESFSPEPNAPFPFEPAFKELDNLVDIHYFLYPDVPLYPWQRQELLRISGYVNGTLDGPRVHFSPQQAYRAAYVTVNGSGKDMVLIATTAFGLPLLYKHVVVVITSKSYEQLKKQTSVHIVNGINLLNEKLGFKVYDTVEFYYTCKERGAEISLFVTDEEGRVEGWHPHHVKGRLVLIVNEAKSIDPPVFGALDRCSGYSHWLEVSSPGRRSGIFYRNHLSAVAHPETPKRGRFFTRKIHQAECPHKSEEDRREMLRKHGENSYIYQTSVLCNFYEQEEEIAIPIKLVEACEGLEFSSNEDHYGIGLDVAAGGDETSLYVRRGAMPVHRKFFRQRDGVDTASIVDYELRLLGIRPTAQNYIFNFDDGGLGKTIGDNLKALHWRLTRRNNQSPALNPRLYLNLGAEMYFHTRDLFAHKLIPAPADQKTRDQLTTRKYDETENQGKKALQAKAAAKSEGIESPDRGDSWVLCYFSYRPDMAAEIERPELAQKRLMTPEEFIARANQDPTFLESLTAEKASVRPNELFTFQTTKI